MPINTDLSVSPYFDDFSDSKNYYKTLFKPSTAVQVRELNQLQTMLQNQIEKFGNNIYKRGTIIDGCNFVYYTSYPYVKINDSQLDGLSATPSTYVGSFAVDPTTNLTAQIINSQDGFESTDPNLKTLYVRYINSGNSGDETSFNSGSVLTVYDYLNSINKVTIGNGSSGFANNDSVVFCSAIAVNTSSNAAFTVGETVVQTGNSHFAIVDSITTYRDKKVLRLRPRQTDLTNTAISATVWQFDTNQTIIGATSGAVANVDEVIGANAEATVVTTADVGKITQINIVSNGSNYYVAPYMTIKSSGTSNAVGARNYNDLALTAYNYLAQVTITTKAGAVGNGYAFGVTEGVIYQKGYFLHVDAQTVIVDKYSDQPDLLSVGFDTKENIIDANADTSLLDNSTGTTNEFAPGADRLNLVPTLVVVDTTDAEANTEFLSIVDFTDGQPYHENRATQFSSLMDEMAKRTAEQSGNFVLDQFLVTTKSTANQASEGQSIAIVVDPGKGYINGYRVETTTNFVLNIDKGIDQRTATNLGASISYGNYVLVNEFAGNFNFNTGTVLQLYDTPRQWLSTQIEGVNPIVPTGNLIGTARIRNVVYDSGEVGTPSAVYRVYLFDIKMSAAYNFNIVRSMHYDATYDGICDIITTFDATSGQYIAKLQDISTGTSLLIDSGSDSTSNLGNLNYIYRTVNETVQLQPTGTASILLTDPTETYGYDSAFLTDNELNTLVISSTTADILLKVDANTYGTANVSMGSTTIQVTPTTVNAYEIGDWISMYNTANTYVTRRVTGKVAGGLVVDSDPGFSLAAANFTKSYPKAAPVALSRLPGASASVSNSGKSLNINLGSNLQSNVNINISATYDVQISGASAKSKVAARSLFVKLQLSTNEAKTKGPWCLGVPDVFRLRGVYSAPNSAVSTASTDITDQFYIDNNQQTDYYGLSYLYLDGSSNIVLTQDQWVLVEFDAFTADAGVYTINSYVSANTAQRFADDSLTLDQLGTKINSFEIPEMYSNAGKYFDLANYIDFRPIVANTALLTTSLASATVNPSSTYTFSNNNKKFPLPQSGVGFDRSYFLSRKDSVIINTDNQIAVARGVPTTANTYPDAKVPNNAIVLSKLIVPSYPCVGQNFSANTFAILNKRMTSSVSLVQRVTDKTVSTETTQSDIDVAQPKVYTMDDIGHLDRRIAELENTVSLSLVESDVKDKVIPSSVDPSINRFKFGFFADDYSTSKNSDTTNVEYQAAVINSEVVPVSESTLLTHGHGYHMGSFTSEYTLINQNIASAPPPPPPPPAPPSPPPAPPSVVPPPTPTAPTAPSNVTPITGVTQTVAVNTSVYRQSSQSTYGKSDYFYVTMSSQPGQFYVDYSFGDGDADALTIYRVINGLWTQISGGRYRNTGRLGPFTHDPSINTQYLFYMYRHSSGWAYTLNYPIDSTAYVLPSPPSTNVNNPFYNGTLASISPGYMSPQALGQNFGKLAYITQGIFQTVTLTGLKPNTTHVVEISDYNANMVVNPIISGGNTDSATSIRTDGNGQATFNLDIDATSSGSVSSLLNYIGTLGTASSVSDKILVSVISSDRTSDAAFFLSAAKAPVAATTAAPTVYSPVVLQALQVLGRNVKLY